MATIHTISSDLGGETLQADCLATDLVGDFVYITGDPVAGFYQVTKVDITDSSNLPTIGVIINKSSTTRCTVQRFGIVDVSTWPSPPTLNANSNYWIGFDSQISDSVPVPVAGISLVQMVGKALSPTEMLLIVGANVYKLRR